MRLWEYFAKRLLLIVPTFLGITIVIFTLVQFLPGGPVEQALMAAQGAATAEGGASGGGQYGNLTAEQVAEIRAAYGFDKPVYVRYWNWLVRDRMGLLTRSYRYKEETAWQRIYERFQVSLIFGITGFVLSYVICVPLGIAKALRHGGVFDLTSSIIVFIGYSIPAFAFGMVLKLLFCGLHPNLWDIFPLAGFKSDNWADMGPMAQALDIGWHMVLPLACYVVGSFAVLTILMKNSLLEQVSQDYVRTVLAKGGSSHRAIWRHALRNSLIPIATGIGSILTLMFAGSVLIERVFEIPGMGRLSLEAMVNRDYPVFLAIMALTALLGLLGAVVRDFVYVLIDPRIDFEGR